MAQSWQQFYSYAAQMNPANPSAAGRAQLMQHVVELFDKGKWMDQRIASRRETLRLNNGQTGPLLLCLEPLGEQVEMMPGQTYEVITAGGEEG